MSRVPRNLIIGVLLVLAVAATYAPVACYDFLNLDDNSYVTENKNVRDGLTWAGARWAFTSLERGNWHPLTWFSHMVDCQVFGIRPGGMYTVGDQHFVNGHHLVNVGLHAASTVLLFWLLTRMTAAVWPSAVVAGLFALHPLHVESVAWIAERKDVLSVFLGLLALLAYVRYAERPSVARYVPVFVLLALGLMAKPMLVTLPLVMLLLDYWPLGRYPLRIANCELRIQTAPARGFFKSAIRNPQSAISFGRTSTLRLVLEKLPLFVLGAGCCVATIFAQHGAGAMEFAEKISWPARVSNAAVAYVVYLGQTFWPAGLAVFYPHVERPLGQAAAAAIFLLGVTALAIWQIRRRPYLAVGWFWYLGTLVPVIGLVQVGKQAMADRYTYLPLVGVFIAMVWSLVDLLGRRRHGAKVLALAACAALVACGVAAAVQVRTWADSVTLFGRAVAVTGDNVVARGNLAVAFSQVGRNDEALVHLNEALRIDPTDAVSNNCMGLLLSGRGEHADAVAHFRIVLRYKPEYYAVHNNLGLTLATQGKLDEAIAEYHESLRLEPTYTPAMSNLGAALISRGEVDKAEPLLREAVRLTPNEARAHNNLGVALVRLGRTDEAAVEYAEALRLDPYAVDAHTNLGVLLGNANRFDEAIEHFNASLRVSPDQPEAHNGLGHVLMIQGHDAEALPHLITALERRPDWPAALTDLARIRAASASASLRNGPQAVAAAERACQLTECKEPVCLDALAAAYAEAGRFADAAQTLRQAIVVARALKQDDLAARMEIRLRLYEAGQPFHEKP
jgi:Flp pilus assembly protein TadD